MVEQGYAYREFLQPLISPVAMSVLERMTPAITEIFNLDELLDAPLPEYISDDHAERFTNRLERIVSLLPPDISPMPNEVFTAIEFLLYEIHGEPIRIGLAIARLEELSDQIKADPLLHSLVIGRAN